MTNFTKAGVPELSSLCEEWLEFSDESSSDSLLSPDDASDTESLPISSSKQLKQQLSIVTYVVLYYIFNRILFLTL
jgi:hypothetical protein